MLELLESSTLGPYHLTRTLDPCAFADRHLALHEPDHSSHVAYRFDSPRGLHARRRLESALAACRSLDHEHILMLEDVQTDYDGNVWAITPFTGDVDGIRTLGKLLSEKRGQMDPFEAERALVQLLGAMVYAHPQVVNGPITLDDVLVDRHGRLLIEFYGLRRAMQSLPGLDQEAMLDEIRSVVGIGYQLITGLRPEEPMIPAGRLVKKLDPQLDRWLAIGLDPRGGFATAEQALAALPSHSFNHEVEVEERPRWGGWAALCSVKTVLGRLRAVKG